MLEFTNVAISKNKFGTTCYALIDSLTRCVVAVFKARDGMAFQIHFIENTPTYIKKVSECISCLERTHAL